MKVRKSIKKPKFLFAYFGSLIIVTVILACMGLIAFYGAKNTYDTLAQINCSDSEANVHTDIEEYLWKKKKITASERNAVKRLLVYHFSKTSQRFKVYFDNEEIADTSQTAIMFYYNDSEHCNLELADKKYLECFKTPEFQKYWKTDSERIDGIGSENEKEILPRFYENKSLDLVVREAYIDLENARFIPIRCEIAEHDNKLDGTPCGPVVSIPVENGSKIPEGYTLYKSSAYFPSLSATIEGFDGTDNDAEYGEIYYSSNGLAFEKFYGYKHTPIKCIPFATVYKAQISKAIWLVIIASLILSLMPATIIYNVQKRKYEIFEYRRKMTDAMAHDLKSPMAAISAFAENLSDNVATDKREYYAGKIEEKVAQMNKMVNNILEFSKSENLPAEIKKEDVDIGAVVGKIIADNDHVIAERSLKINCEKKNITIQTDIKLFSQAVSNLINNAVLYSKEDTAIDISFDEKSLVISNTPAKKVDNAAELKQPFVKGSDERSTQGSGLGLAIAENNLAMLGYKLDVGIVDGRFVATVKL